MSSGFNGANNSGFYVIRKNHRYLKTPKKKINSTFFIKVNYIDVASNFAGSLMGISQTVANSCGFIVPAVVGLIVTNEVLGVRATY